MRLGRRPESAAPSAFEAPSESSRAPSAGTFDAAPNAPHALNVPNARRDRASGRCRPSNPRSRETEAATDSADTFRSRGDPGPARAEQRRPSRRRADSRVAAMSRLCRGCGSSAALTRGCFCGAIRYRVSGARSDETLCHCSICRRVSGAPFVAWFTAPRDGFAFTRGTPAEFSSTEHGRRTFCADCGTPLTFASSRLPAELDVTTGSLDDPEAAPPKDHTRTSARLSWVDLGDRLPRHPEHRA